MRYIGNKENIVANIYQILLSQGINGNSFFDFFSGTTNVAKFYKNKGYRVECCDKLFMSFCLQKAYIENNQDPQFSKLLKIIHCQTELLFNTPLDIIVSYLNSIPPIEGFIYHNYTPTGTSGLKQPRMYFSDDNGKKIDAIRQQIEVWRDMQLLTEYEYFILISCLIETVSFYSNVAGVYAAFSKKWDARAIKPLVLRPINTLDNGKKNIAHWGDSLSIIDKINVDVLYLDPPYNERQYLPNYHLIETIARYDNPEIRGVTGMREYKSEKSTFCNAETALRDLEVVIKNANYKYLVMSYNTEGIMKQNDIVSMMSNYGSVVVEQFEYARYKSNNNGLSKTVHNVYEQLYILTKKNSQQ